MCEVYSAALFYPCQDICYRYHIQRNIFRNNTESAPSVVCEDQSPVRPFDVILGNNILLVLTHEVSIFVNYVVYSTNNNNIVPELSKFMEIKFAPYTKLLCNFSWNGKDNNLKCRFPTVVKQKLFIFYRVVKLIHAL